MEILSLAHCLGLFTAPFAPTVYVFLFLPALLCYNEVWEYPDLHQLGSSAKAAVISSLTEWSAEGFVKHTHTITLHLPSDQRKFVLDIQNP